MNVRFLLLQQNTFSIVATVNFHIQNNAVENIQVEQIKVAKWTWNSTLDEVAAGAFGLASVSSRTG